MNTFSYFALFSCIALIVNAYEDESGILVDPETLANQINSERCATNWSQVEEFYKKMRNAENRDTQFPNPSINSEYAYIEQSETIFWIVGGVVPILQPYLGRRLANVRVELFTWCIYPLSQSLNMYGCINSTHQWSTSEFKAMGFLDAMSITNVSNGASYYKGNLFLNASGLRYRSALTAALVSCTITLPDNKTIGIYYSLDLEPYRGSTLVGISPQSEAFLINGQTKNFTCRSRGGSAFRLGHTWYEDGEDGQFDKICQTTSFYHPCDDSSAYQLKYKDGTIEGCEFYFPNPRMTNDTVYLIFTRPTLNDTGEYMCTSTADKPGLSLYIDVVFTKLPPKATVLSNYSSYSMTCEMKAPSDAKIYWTQKKSDKSDCSCQVPMVDQTDQLNMNSVPLCMHTSATVQRTEKVLDNRYSLFSLELQIDKVGTEHIGEYICNVKYTNIGQLTDTQHIKQKSIISVDI